LIDFQIIWIKTPLVFTISIIPHIRGIKQLFYLIYKMNHFRLIRIKSLTGQIYSGPFPL